MNIQHEPGARDAAHSGRLFTGNVQTDRSRLRVRPLAARMRHDELSRNMLTHPYRQRTNERTSQFWLTPGDLRQLRVSPLFWVPHNPRHTTPRLTCPAHLGTVAKIKIMRKFNMQRASGLELLGSRWFAHGPATGRQPESHQLPDTLL